jgi:hypothetical protein
MAQFDYNIEVDDGNNARVTPTDGLTLHKNDTVTFKSNKPESMIKYKTSPITTLPPGKQLLLGRGKKGPFKITKVTPRRKIHIFECGRLIDSVFTPWGGGGGGTPVGG